MRSEGWIVPLHVEFGESCNKFEKERKEKVQWLIAKGTLRSEFQNLTHLEIVRAQSPDRSPAEVRSIPLRGRCGWPRQYEHGHTPRGSVQTNGAVRQ